VLAGSLSDLAALGARPKAFLLSLTISPRETGEDGRFFWAFIEGIAQASSQYRTPLLGGNLTRGGSLSIHCVVFGEIRTPFLPRGRVQPGDDLWITGTIGDSALGLQLFEEGRSPGASSVKRYFSPEPRLKWGELLHQQKWLTGMVDISDGWARDLYNLVFPSGFGVELDPPRIPRSPLWRRSYAREEDHCKKENLYWGGDDYELAFSTRKGERDKVDRFLSQKGIPARWVGRVAEKPGIHFLSPPEVAPLPEWGYDALLPFYSSSKVG
jgi:thiamine-monophosphate kinase